MTATYATYNGNTWSVGYNASRTVRYKRDGAYCKVAIFDPPAVSPVTGETFAGARPVYCFETGGGRQNKDDRGVTSSPTMTMFTDELGGYVCIFTTTPGGMDRAEAEEVDMALAPECISDGALLVMFLRAHATDTAVVGSTRTMQTEPRYWLMGGDSAGAWLELRTQMLPAGTFAEIGSALAASGGGYRYDPDHTCGNFFAYESQNRLSTFNETVYSSAGSSAYVVNTTATVGASTVSIVGDTLALRRANRLAITGTFGYVTSGALTGSATIPVTTGTAAVPQGANVVFVVNDVNPPYDPITYTHTVSEDYAGGAGSIKIAGNALTVDVPAATAIKVQQVVAVVSDVSAPVTGATPATVTVWPPLMMAFPATTSTVSFGHDVPESYGEPSWAGAYVMSAGQGYTWRTFPIARKREADVDFLVVAENPRVKEINLMISSPSGLCLQRVDSLTHARSFWPRWNQTTPAPLPEHIDLHDCSQMAALAHEMYLAGNRNNVHAYLGGRDVNPNATNVDLPWLKGRNASFSASALKAFLMDVDRQGGALA